MSSTTKNSIAALKTWLPDITAPLIITGPCSAESRRQVRRTAHALVQTGRLHIFRAGIWKPRTRPGSFQGVGAEGLNWLREIREETGIPVTTEVATPKQTEQALAAGIDMLWLGARTTANPFAVQEIADTLKGSNVPVLIKNPVSPDLELWIGAIERIRNAGIDRLAAIHRGFTHYGTSRYRNRPHWQIPIELRRRLPKIPLLCDPSHMTGKRELLAEAAQKALDLAYEGLFIETHIEPATALSDANQQLTPSALKTMLKGLVLRRTGTTNNSFNRTITELRKVIDRYDERIMALLIKRMRVAAVIGQIKQENNVTILQPQRWEEVLTRALEQGIQGGLSKGFIEELFQAIHQESISHQEKV